MQNGSHSVSNTWADYDTSFLEFSQNIRTDDIIHCQIFCISTGLDEDYFWSIIKHTENLKNGSHIGDDSFIFLKENVCILIQNSLKFLLKVLSDII